MKQGKIWGDTEEIFNNGIVSVNFIRINKGGFCSEHRHRKKSNKFYVITGDLIIEIFRDGIKDETILGPGEATTVEAGVWHKFMATSYVECFEIYEVKFTDADIERRTTGGNTGV